MGPETTWRGLVECLRRGGLEGAALAAAALDAERAKGGEKPDAVPVIAWKPGALRSLARLLVAAIQTGERNPGPGE